MNRNQKFAPDVAHGSSRAALGLRPNVSSGLSRRLRLTSFPSLSLGAATLVFLALGPSPAAAEPPRPITLRQAIGIALEQNSDVLLARLDAEKAEYAVREARAPFSPQLVVGSGLAATSGIPQSVEGASPSIVRAVGRQFLYNREQSNRVKQARELAVAAEHVVASRQDEVAFRVASTYLDFERSWRRSRLLSDQAESLVRVERVVAARVAEGRAIPLAERRARLDAAKADRAMETEQAQVRVFEATLRHELGLGRESRLEPAPSDFVQIAKLPQNPSAARALALEHNPRVEEDRRRPPRQRIRTASRKGITVPQGRFSCPVFSAGALQQLRRFFQQVSTSQRAIRNVGTDSRLRPPTSRRPRRVKFAWRQDGLAYGAKRSSQDSTWKSPGYTRIGNWPKAHKRCHATN